MGNEKEKIDSYTVMRYDAYCPPSYKNFILSRWMRSYRLGNDYIKLTDSDSYFGTYSSYIMRLLIHPAVQTRIAVLTLEPDIALGFSVCRGDMLDYVHVHKHHRRQGVARKLIPSTITQFSHLTKTGMKLWPTKLPSAKFNPFH